MDKLRRSSGQGWLALVLIIAIFIILPLGLLAFDINRYYWASLQMRSAVDAAALSGVAALASGNNAAISAAQTAAVDSAFDTFKRNSIFGVPLTCSGASYPYTAYINAPKPTSVPVGQSQLYVDLFDQNRAPVNIGDEDGRVLRVTGYYGYRAAFATYCGFPDVTLVATSDGAVPQLDLILCFDISGSMDDATPVIFVKRYWDATNNRIGYTRVNSAGNDDIRTELGVTQINGTTVNAAPPQNLYWAGSGSNTAPAFFSELAPSQAGPMPFSASGLRSRTSPEAGQPPGNYDPLDPTNMNGNGVNPNAHARLFTDMIVRIDGQTSGNWVSTSHTFGGVTYWFPTYQATVEAARGNLDSLANYSSSLANTNAGLMPSVGAGFPQYKAAYLDAVNKKTNSSGDPVLAPMGYSRNAAKQFFDLMRTNTDAHFGLVAFTDKAGSAGEGNPGYWPDTSPIAPDYYSVSPDYTAGGVATVAVPKVTLSQTADNYSQVDSQVGTLMPAGGTNIGDSLRSAINDLNDPTKFRTGSQKAIVLFTDGIPNKPGGLGAAETDAYTAAQSAADSGIKIYTIGLALYPVLYTDQDRILGDGRGGTSATGIAGRTGGLYFRVDNASELNDAFRVIARQLVQLTVVR